jgi:broad specificity phosphatase PhoE
MIILIRHAQSEGNKNREIHQLIPDHRVKLTDDGWVQVMLDQYRPSSETVIN